MLYTKLLKERIKASCVGVMLRKLPADSSYLWDYMQEHQMATAYAYYSYSVYFLHYYLAEYEYE